MREQCLSWDAMKPIDSLHVAGFYLFAIFLVVHVYMATLGPNRIHAHQGHDRGL